MKNKKIWVFLPLLFVSIMAGFYLSFFNVNNVKADGTYFSINPAVVSTDNLIGATASWTFSATTTASLASGDVVQFIFPTTVNSIPFDLSSLSVTASSGIQLYSDVGSASANLIDNPSFESATTSWNDSFSHLGSTPHDVTTTAYHGSGALEISPKIDFVAVGPPPTVQIKIGQFGNSSIQVPTFTTHTYSFYVRGANGGETARFAIAGNSNNCDPGNNYFYNFVSSTATTSVFGCFSQQSFAPYGIDSAYYRNVTTTDTFQRITQTFNTRINTSTALNLLVGDTTDNRITEHVIFDAAQLELGSSTSTFSSGATPATTGTGVADNTVVYGFVTSTIPVSSTIEFTFGGVVNPKGAPADLADLDFSLKGGTPDNVGQPGGDISTKFLYLDTESITRAGGSIVSDFNSVITPSSRIAAASDVDYSFTFTATSSIPSGGKIVLNFPTEYSLNGASVVVANNGDINGSVTGTPQIADSAITTTTTSITLTTSNAVTVADDTITVVVGGITNPANSDVDSGDAYNTFYVYTTKSNDGLIDGSYAVADYGDAPYLGTVTILPAVPAQASAPTATASSTTQIDLSWTAVASSTYYIVYQSTDNTTFSFIATTTAITYSNTSLSAGTTYYYKIAGVNAGGTGTQSTASSTATESETCATVTGAATYNAYPTCGAATCSSGYTLSGSTCAVSSSGGGGSSAPPVSTGAGSNTQQVGMNATKNAGSITGSVNAIMYIGSQLGFSVGGQSHDMNVSNLDMINRAIDLEFHSEVVKIKLAVGDIGLLDLDSDGINDLKVKFNALVSNRIDLTITNLDEIVSTTIESTKTIVATKPVSTTKPVVNKHNFTSYLFIGNSGQEVKDLQTLLKNLGHFTYPTITGYFGNVTKQAVVAYQKAKGLSPFPGWLGPQTRKALNGEGGVSGVKTKVKAAKKAEVKIVDLGNYEFKSYLYIGNQGEEVRKLQEALEDLGYFTYSAGPTGYFGNVTKQAVTAYQKAKGLSPFPGWIGPGTRKALNSL